MAELIIYAGLFDPRFLNQTQKAQETAVLLSLLEGRARSSN